MAFKTRNSKNEDGTYTLSYGRQSKKLSSTMEQGGDGWSVVDGDGPALGPYKTMKECKAEWGAWAELHYETGGTPAPQLAGPPKFAPPKRSGQRVVGVVTYDAANNAEIVQVFGAGSTHEGKYFCEHHGPFDTTTEAGLAWLQWAKANLGGTPFEPPEMTSAPEPAFMKRAKSGPPPAHKPKSPPSHKPVPIELRFNVDPFDARFRYPSDYKVQRLRKQLTPLGALFEIWKTAPTALVEKQLALYCPDLINKETGHVQTPAEKAADNRRKLTPANLSAAINHNATADPDDDIPF